MINWYCTNCRESLEAPESEAGQTMPCPECGSQQVARERQSMRAGAVVPNQPTGLFGTVFWAVFLALAAWNIIASSCVAFWKSTQY